MGQTMDFKFFQKPKPQGNMYLMFNMDDALINVIRWLRYHNQNPIYNDVYLHDVNVPINYYLRIIGWLNFTNLPTPIIEINYRVFGPNTTPVNFVCKMEESEFIRRTDITGIQ